jgi:hypothetical protein
VPDDPRRRVLILRDQVAHVYRQHPELGPIEEKLYWMTCDGCGLRQELDDSRAFLDLPEQLEGWARIEGRDLCPRCARASR